MAEVTGGVAQFLVVRPHYAMRVIPTSKQEWSRFILFPFKAYSVLGIFGFLVWDRFYYQLHSHAFWTYRQVGGTIMLGYMVCAGVLLFGSLIQLVALKSKLASSSFIFGIIDFVIAMILPAFFPG